MWKKNLTFFSLLLSLSMGGVLGPILSPATADVAKEFSISIADAALVGGYPLMTAGVGAFIAQAWASILGKRSAYMISTAILFASTVWSSLATDFSSLLASRILQGFGNGAYESILIASIGDLFFVCITFLGPV
jgi:predicted MFS family arabinose efflux permease